MPKGAKQTKTFLGGLWLLLAVALVVRLGLALTTEGFTTDVTCFSAWAFRLAEVGPQNFYAPDYFADYPPGYLLVLWGVGTLAKSLGLAFGAKSLALLLAVVPILCDLGAAALLYAIGKKYINHRAGLVAAALAAFCPPLLYNTAVWKQVDGVFGLCILGVFWLLCQKRFLPAAALYGLALAIKPQALLFGPALAACFLVAIAMEKELKGALKAAGQAVLGAALSVAMVFLCAIPFEGFQPQSWLLEKYTGTVESYPYASINGFNLLTLFGGNWKQQELAAGPLTWEQWGTVGIALSTLALAVLTVLLVRKGRFCPLLLAGFYGVAVFTLSHRMHERYLLPALLLVLAAAVRWGDRRLLGSFCLLSLSSLLNLSIVLTSNGTEDQFLTTPLATQMIFVISLIEVAGFVLLCWGCVRVALRGAANDWQPGAEKAAALRCPPAAQPGWGRGEGVFLAVTTLLVAFISIWNLGDTKAPQNPLDATNFVATTEIQIEAAANEVWIYPGVSWGGSVAVFDEAGNELVSRELGYDTTFKWQKLQFEGLAPGRYTIELNNAQMMEMALRGEDGRLLATGAELDPLFDEQALVPDQASYKNSMYFDEIYHGRTGYEHLNGMPVYETTHPPLGKVFIMLGIAVFGMTGFGWRIAGVVFGIAMVPVLYLLVRRLTRSPKAAAFAAILAGLDLMRLAQSRIATIDVYGTFFILLGAYFMVWYCQSVLQKGVLQSLWPMALAGIAFGLGAASKWTGIYAGAGLAILYFAVLWQRRQQKLPGFNKELAAALVGGVLFFVLVPLVIYIGSYLPYWWREGGFSLGEWWRCQVNMYNYHSTLNATHSFESRWFTWPLALRPVWYYVGSGLPSGMYATISGLANPAVWWAGLAGFGVVFWRQLSGRGSRAGGALIVLLFTQLLPWVLVTRCTFMYHYFPSLWFTVAALALVLHQWSKTRPKAARYTALGIMGLAAVLFVCFYPVATGLPVAESWAKGLEWLPTWYF